MYTISKFVTFCKDNGTYKKTLLGKLNATKAPEFELQVITSDFLERSYGELDWPTLRSTVLSVFDIYNDGYQEQIVLNCKTILEEPTIKPQFVNSLHYMRHVTSVKKHFNLDVLNALSLNLSKGSRALRLESLRVMCLSTPLEFKKESKVNKDEATVAQYYTGHCNVITLLKECEEIEITVSASKEKVILLRKVSLMCSSGYVPREYLHAVYSYCIGCLWVKFTPLH
jgi:hypothetical protein